MAVSRKITVNEKLLKQIRYKLNEILDLNNIEEFQEMRYRNGDLFKDAPDGWTDEERAICDYVSRMNMSITKAITDILTGGNETGKTEISK